MLLNSVALYLPALGEIGLLDFMVLMQYSPGKQESCFSREHDTQLISLPLLQHIFSGGLSNSILFKSPVPVLEYLCHQKAMALFYLFLSSNSHREMKFCFPITLIPQCSS